jgi:FkbM family methyltransferase
MHAKNGIFIDCGGHDGCSVVKFLSQRPGFRCVTFEPNPELAHYYRYLPTTLVRKAVSTYDGTVDFTVDPLDGDGSSIVTGKNVVWDGSIANTDCPTVSVGCIDLSRYIADNVRPDDYLCLKVDVEGAEYEIFDKMLRDGTLALVRELYVEFHWFKCGVPREAHDRLVRELEKKVELRDWDARSHAIHKLGYRQALKRALSLARIWPMQLISRPAGRPGFAASA